MSRAPTKFKTPNATLQYQCSDVACASAFVNVNNFEKLSIWTLFIYRQSEFKPKFKIDAHDTTTLSLGCIDATLRIFFDYESWLAVLLLPVLNFLHLPLIYQLNMDNSTNFLYKQCIFLDRIPEMYICAKYTAGYRIYCLIRVKFGICCL